MLAWRGFTGMTDNMTTFRILGLSAIAWLASGLTGAFAMAGAPLTKHDKVIYAQAFRLAEAERFDTARALGRTAADPRLAKVILWLDYTTPRPKGREFPNLAQFLESNPNWPGRGSLRLHAETVMPDDLPGGRVLSWFKDHEALTVKGAVRFAEALIDANRRDQAIEVLRTTWVERTFGRGEAKPFLKRFGTFIREQDHIARLERLIWSRAYNAARRQARRLGKDYVALTEARLSLAGNRGGVDAAIRRVPVAMRGDPGLLYERARWRQHRQRYEGVIELLDPPIPLAPRAERWWTLRQWAVRKALTKGDISVAYRIASGHGMSAGIGFAEAEWLAGWIALRFLDQPRDAYTHFIRLHDGVSSSVSLGRGAFWAGEAARVLAGKPPHAQEARGLWHRRARQWYANAATHDTSFYGLLASRRLGRDPMVDLRTRSTLSPEARQSFDERELVQIVRLLSEVGEKTLMERFLIRLKFLAKTGKDYALLAGLARSVDRPDLATSAARAARGKGIILPGFLFPSMTLPVAGQPGAGQPGAERPETALLLALIRQESGFYPRAVSRSGARGLMQIMPATARHVARRIKVSYSRDKLLDDPKYNLLLGRSYLSGLLDRYDGSYVLALAGYNAGPARADRWIEDFGDPRDPNVDTIDWIESIAFDETRNYVQRILESLIAYRQLLGTVRLGQSDLPELSPFGPLQALRASNQNFSCCI